MTKPKGKRWAVVLRRGEVYGTAHELQGARVTRCGRKVGWGWRVVRGRHAASPPGTIPCFHCIGANRDGKRAGRPRKAAA